MNNVRRIVKMFFKGLMPFLFVLLILTPISFPLYVVYLVSPTSAYIIGAIVLIVAIYLSGEYMEETK